MTRPARWRTAGLAIVAAMAAVLPACVSGDLPAAPADDAELVEGRTVYAAQCASCHGADGSGGTGSRLDEGRMAEAYPDPADQRAVIADGRRAMPAFGNKLSDAEIDAVVRYTREVLSGGS
ncbi:MAG: c-type cytochrome [Acidimicrobiales bacterium]